MKRNERRLSIYVRATAHETHLDSEWRERETAIEKNRFFVIGMQGICLCVCAHKSNIQVKRSKFTGFSPCDVSHAKAISNTSFSPFGSHFSLCCVRRDVHKAAVLGINIKYI